ncbi:AAA family ATPase [Echinicola marina]|uniref:AAA family ATPase n=1 Tax=Echinicola marina TaxID=2859768 RepID=UPI001CF6FD5C|nr:AAA family ATPase [Echinicola marina]UCS92443.1 AAA family ATPase [Echinicola marina]
MIDEWLYLVKKFSIAGARHKFEEICASLFKRKFPSQNVKSVRVSVGDGGIDIFIGKLGIEPIKIVQCKFFVDGIKDSQRSQIRESFKKIITSDDFMPSQWILCIPEKLSISEHKWWSDWKNRQIANYNLSQEFIELYDGEDLIEDLRKYDFYNEVFDHDYRTAINEIHEVVVSGKLDLEHELRSASFFVRDLKNYFSKNTNTHVSRKETIEIFTWINSDLPGKNKYEKLLIIKGLKGVGKSTIIRDSYFKLSNQNDLLILAIKCDQFYGISLKDLSKKLFNNVNSFQELFYTISKQEKKLIVFLDQLDALSQTLSSNREYLRTYVKLIYELINLKNVRIIISSRNFDLEYDADLRKINSESGIKRIEVGSLSPDEVNKVLKSLGISVKNQMLINLLTTPYNLELFTLIPDLEKILQYEERIPLSKLYLELWGQILVNRELNVIDCLDVVVERMYNAHPNLIDQSYLKEHQPEIDYLISNGIILKNENKLSFFHQSFYEHYLARWFVESKKDLIEYIFDEDQNLYIRSLIKQVIEYLREVNHNEYIDLYRKAINSDHIRFHIKFLFILQFGLVDMPTHKEKRILIDILQNKYGKVFLDVVNSRGWIYFLITNSLIPENENETFQILFRNINYHPYLILSYLENSSFESKEKMIAELIPNIKIWDQDLLPFFNEYYSFNDNTEIWYFETLKKIAPLDLNFVLEKIRPVVISEMNRHHKPFKFDYKFAKIIDQLYQNNPKKLSEFLLSIFLQYLEDTKSLYFNDYHGIESELLGSNHYDNRLYYKDSEDEKSIEFYLLKYYRNCGEEEVEKMMDSHIESNYIQLLIIIAKLLQERVKEFTHEAYRFILIIDKKNGFKGPDDFFQLNMRKLISGSLINFNIQQFLAIKEILLTISNPYEIVKYTNEGKRKLSLKLGLKQYLFIKALPDGIRQKDIELKRKYQMFSRRFGEVDYNKAFDRPKSSFGPARSPLSNPNFDKFGHQAWINSMRKIDENFKSDDFFKGGLLELSRSFSATVKKKPDYLFGLIVRLFNERGISPSYISQGISGLIDAEFDGSKISELIEKEIKLDLDKSHTLYAVWHTQYLIDLSLVSEKIINFWVSTAKSSLYLDDVLNPNDPLMDFINTPRGAAIYSLIHSYMYPQYKESIFSTIEFVISPKNNPSSTILAGIMTNLGLLNHLDIERSFLIFQKLIALKSPIILKHSIMSAQYFNNVFHDRMGFYFEEMLLHEELYDKCYFFISSWIFDHISDYEMYDNFINLGEKSIKCGIEVAEELLINNGKINTKAIEVLERCMKYPDIDISNDLSGLILRKFKIENFRELYSFIEKYISTPHFRDDPQYLFDFLLECSALYPTECLALLVDMDVPENVDIRKRAFNGDESLVLILSIYSKLRLKPFKYLDEQNTALDVFDKLLQVPSIRNRANDALDKALN